MPIVVTESIRPLLDIWALKSSTLERNSFRIGDLFALLYADNQVDRWGISSDRTAGHGPRKKIIWVEGQQRYGAGRRDHGYRMGNVVHFVIRNDIQAGPLQVVLDDNPRGRGRLRRYDECFAHDLSQLDGVMRGKAVVAGEHDDERLRNHTPVNQLVRPLFRPHERGVEPAPRQVVSEVRGILA